MNGQIIPEETEKSIEVKQENATFLVIGDKAYTSEIIEEYNRNAEAKTEDFNTNAENKTASYNSNAADRTTAFNNNYDDKITAFNSNANKQTEEFDSHVLMQTNTFNNNAASTIANYNSNAEQKTNEFNQNALSYQEGIDANKKHIINVSNELERVKNDVLETGTDTDTYIHLEDSAMAEYQELSIDGVCEQETTTGKNYFNILSAKKAGTSQISNGITFTYNDDGTITANGTNTSGTQSSIEFILPEEARFSTTNKKMVLILEGGSISGVFALALRDINYSTIRLIEIGSLTTKISNLIDDKVVSRPKFYTYGNCSMNNVKIKIMVIDKDITDYTYEPFTNLQPSPSPDYPQEIKTIENSLKITSCNKNLMDPNKVITGYFIKTSDGTLVKSNTDSYVEYTLIKPNETYWKPSTNHFALYDKDKKFIKSENGKKIITTPNSMYIRWTLSDSDLRLEQYLIQSEVEPTSFEQHLETQIEANLPEGEFIAKINDTYKDTLKIEYNEEDGQYHLNLYKGIGRELINKPATGYLNNNGTYPYFYFNGEPSLDENRFSVKLNYLSKAYNVADMANKENNNNTIYWGSNNTFIRIDKFTTTEEYIEWLNSVDLILYAPLKAPYVIDLGVVDMPITYNETTNMFTDSDLLPQINAKYYRNFISTVRNLQVNEKALKQELIDINTRLSALESTITSVASESEVVE